MPVITLIDNDKEFEDEEVCIALGAKHIAYLFWSMDLEEQSVFFNQLSKIEHHLMENQISALRSSPHLNEGGKRLLKLFGGV
jgi:hypothetical protein